MPGPNSPAPTTAGGDVAPAAVPCTGCGNRYLQSAALPGPRDTCGCAGCDNERARLAALAETGTADDASVTEDGSAYLVAARFTYDNGLTRVAPACVSCFRHLFDAVRSGGDGCLWCGTSLVPLGGVMAMREHPYLSTAAHAALAAFEPWLAGPGGSSLRTVGRSDPGGLGERDTPSAVSHTLNAAYMMFDGSTGDRTTLCERCHDDAYSCESCSRLVSQVHTCRVCDTATCETCHSEEHYECDLPNTDGDTVRRNFRPRASIRDALALDALAGTVVRTTRAVGVEIETARGNLGAVVAAERGAAVPILAACGTDGSVRGANAVEFRLLPQRGVMVEYALRHMATWCREAGFDPDESAGIHMHVDCSDVSPTDVNRAYALLLAAEDVLLAHSAPHRRGNQYCAPLPNRPLAISGALARAARGEGFDPYAVVPGRYHVVNAHSYSNHRTLEVRSFDSTHADADVVRLTDAAAIIAGTVEFALHGGAAMFAFCDAWADRWSDADVSSALLLALAGAEMISAETANRAMTRTVAERHAPGTGCVAA